MSTHRDTVKLYSAFCLAGAVWAVTPLSWLAVFYRFATHYLAAGNFYVPHPPNFFLRLLWYHALCDIPFSLYLKWLVRHAKRDHPPPRTALKVLSVALHRALNPAADSREEEKALTLLKLRRWFYHAPVEDIKADNVREWLAWAFGGSELEQCQQDPERKALVEEGLKLVEERCNVRFQPGYNPRVKSLRLTLDKIKTLHRPFGYYVVCNGISGLSE